MKCTVNTRVLVTGGAEFFVNRQIKKKEMFKTLLEKK